MDTKLVITIINILVFLDFSFHETLDNLVISHDFTAKWSNVSNEQKKNIIKVC